jgi:CRP-like cAMP-binding protein
MEGQLTLEGVINFLLETPLFADLDPTELAEIVRIMQVQRLRPGQSVFREGEVGDAWFVIYEGRASVSKDNGFGPARNIANLEPHACFGEMAVLDGSERSATVKAETELTLFRFRRAPFQDLMEEGSLAAFKLVTAMARVLCARQRSLNRQIADLLEREADHGPVKQGLGPIIDNYSVSE